MSSVSSRVVSEQAVSPDRIMQAGLAFWSARTLLSAVELGVFTELAPKPLDGETLGRRLGLHPRSRRDFLDTLVSLGFLNREDDVYSNMPDTDLYLDQHKPSYLGGILEMAGRRSYPFWGSLTEALRSGKPQNESKGGKDTFSSIYQTPESMKNFARAMTGVSMPANMAMARKFTWDRYKTFVDIGTAQGGLPVQIALANPHLTGVGVDLPEMQPVFEEYVNSFNLGGRLSFTPCDIFNEPFPEADVIIMGHILHDWDMDKKRLLIMKAYEALPESGALIVYESIIDDDRRQNAFGLLMSLNMLVETEGGFDFTGEDCRGWLHHAGFTESRVEHLVGPDSMVVGIK